MWNASFTVYKVIPVVNQILVKNIKCDVSYILLLVQSGAHSRAAKIKKNEMPQKHYTIQ